MEAGITEIQMSRAGDALTRGRHPRLQRRQRHHHFEGGTGRVKAIGGLVDQRGCAIGRPLPPLRAGDAGIEDVRVKARLAGHGQHLAIAGVEHHDRGSLLDLATQRLLQFGVDADLDILAGHALAPVKLADHPADRIDLKLHRAGAATQQQVMMLLDTRSPDAHARQLQQRVAIHVALGRRRHIAHHMGQVLTLGVETRGADIDQNARQVGGIDLDAGHFLPGQKFANNGRHKAAAAAKFALNPRPLIIGQRHDPRKSLQGGGNILGLLGHQQDAPVQPIASDHLSIAVQNAATWRAQ